MANHNVKLITRKSPLALVQAEEIMASMPGLNYKLISIESYGDKNKNISLFPGVPADFFTRELDEAILSGKADIAVHSAKDVPFPLKDGLEVIAITRSKDPTDSLVSRNNLTLKQLSPGSKVGTSSALRKYQLLRIRPDVKVVSVRGTIEERMELIDNGKIDTLIVATCALKRLGFSSRIAEILPFETNLLQGSLAVVAKKSRADLKTRFSIIDVRQGYGKVYLIGAGSGGRDLMTLKAVAILKHADVIYYDDLIDLSLLHDCGCRKVYVGKRKGKHNLPQDDINRQLYESAIKKQIVVRLKGGDPFIFGRGGEELIYLRDRFVDVEVVPGITAAQTAGASAGLPLTLRGVSNTLSMLSAHNAYGNGKTDGETLVYYMGASKLKEIRDDLLQCDADGDTPVALIHKAGFMDEKVTLTSLRSMNIQPQESPLMVIVGKTAGLCRQRDKILFTGLDPYNCLVPGQLVHSPLIEIQPVGFDADIHQYDGVVFTSRQAVQIFCKQSLITKKQKIISIGLQTTKELKGYGYIADYEAKLPDSDSAAALIIDLKLKRVVYPCSNLSDNNIHRLPSVEKRVIYKTTARKQSKVKLARFSGIVFSSSSTVDAFFALYKTIPRHLVLYVYGKHTADSLIKKGYGANVQTVSPQ